VIRKILHSFIPLLAVFLFFSVFLVWAHFLVEEKSNRELVIEIPHSQQEQALKEAQSGRVLYPLFLGAPPKFESPKQAIPALEKEIAHLERVGQGPAPRELNELLSRAMMLHQYKDAKKLRPHVIQSLDLAAPGRERATLRYNLAVSYLISDEFEAARIQLEQAGAVSSKHHRELALGFVWANLKQDEKAQPLLEQAMELVSPSMRGLIHFKLGNLRMRQKRYLEALDLFERALEQNPEYYYPKVNQAIILTRLERFEEAEQIYAELLTERPSYFNGIYNYGILLHKQDRDPEAIKTFKRALNLNPRHMSLREKLAGLLFSDKQFTGALKQYRWLMDRAPNTQKYRFKTAKTLSRLGQYAEAVRLVNYAIEKKGGDYIQAWLELGDIHLSEGQDPLALQAYEKALQLDTKNQDALARMAKFYSRQKKAKKELVYYQRALKLNPMDGLLLRRLGIALLDQGRVKEAIAHLLDSLPQVKNPYRSYKYLAEAYALEKERKLAEKYYLQALALEPEDNLDWYNRARNLEKLKQYPKASLAFEKAIAYTDRGNHDFLALIHRRMAEVEQRRNEYAAAVEHLNLALELRNDYFTARLHLAGLQLRELGESEAGLKQLKLALRLKPKNCRALELAALYKLTIKEPHWKRRCSR